MLGFGANAEDQKVRNTEEDPKEAPNLERP
jgi:hypothetical protein